MSDTVKLIIEIPKDRYTDILRIADVQIVRRTPTLEQIVANGIPLEDVKAEIETDLSWSMFDENGNETRLHKDLMEILANIGKESED